MTLSEEALRTNAGQRIFERGEDYVRYVHGLHLSGAAARASIQARRVYQVDLEWSEGLSGSCTCPHHAEGAFCKHMVAVGLAALDELPRPQVDGIDGALARLDAPALRHLVRELAHRDPAVARLVTVRASEESDATATLQAAVGDVLNPRGFVDYRRSFDVAAEAENLLDEMERHLDAGAAEAVRPALLRAVNELRTLAGASDDSAGVIGSACQRAADLHARSCREGAPDGMELARWLVTFRESSPGWPQTPLEAYVVAFDEKALAEYAAGVERLRERCGDDDFERMRIDAMLVELADHRGDVDAAVDLLSRRPYPRYGAVIERLRGAGRDDEVLTWMDRAVDAGKVSNRLGRQGREYWLDPHEVAAARLAVGREDDALDVLRAQYREAPDEQTFTALVRFAEALGRRDAERDWALATARAAASGYAQGAALVEIALADGDLPAAWQAAGTYGAGNRWRELAAASAETMPRESADLHRAWLEDELRHADTRRYGPIADTLVLVRDRYVRAGAEADFAEYLADIRSRFGRRTSLMKELAQRGLP
jgi:hypothetical protein